jgi:DNA-binding transcriptional MerR regulator
MTKRFRIGELAKRGQCSVKAVRFYEARGLLPAPPRSPAGYRLYDERHVRCLQLIRRTQRLGLSLAKIRTLVVHVGDGSRPGARLRPQLARLIRQQLTEIEAQLDQLGTLKTELESLLARIHDADGALPRELCVCATPSAGAST